MRHFPWKELGYAVGFVTLLAVLYVGAYYSLAIAHTERLYSDPAFALNIHSPYTVCIFPEYRIGGESAVRFIEFMHGIDKTLRPDTWQTIK